MTDDDQRDVPADEPHEQDVRELRLRMTWYLHTARNAVRAVLPNFRPVDVPGDEPPTEPLMFESARSALAWFELERANLIATLRTALEKRLFGLAWRLPAAIYGLFERHRHWEEWRQIHLWGLAAARELGDRHGQARNLLGLGDAEWLIGNTGTALEHYAAAIEANREVGDGWIEGFALRQTGLIRWERDQAEEAPALLRQAIDVFRRANEQRGEGMALLSLAECERSAGRFDQALEHCRTAIAIFTEIEDTWTIAWGRYWAATVLHSAGKHPQAVDEYQMAASVFRDLEDRDSESLALIGIGEAYTSQGDPDRARTHLGAALDLLRSLDDPRADEIEAKIARLE
ncbi:tetratricopeptide repeat protein [Nocardiopsis gilva]|nr:tetratricopeptide repeat protein [Nocardiopsis gilva]